MLKFLIGLLNGMNKSVKLGTGTFFNKKMYPVLNLTNKRRKRKNNARNLRNLERNSNRYN